MGEAYRAIGFSRLEEADSLPEYPSKICSVDLIDDEQCGWPFADLFARRRSPRRTSNAS
jgi:hypothetical protein